ncbi:MAG: diguanylate cyclase, partial [Spirochaetaceae bacterium]|nr:diguanylate cyclase [Spirochaetaceae bacterium]
MGSAGNSIFRFNPDTGHVEHFSTPGETSAIMEGPDGLIWTGSAGEGLIFINPDTGDTRSCNIDPEHPYRLPSARIETLFFGSSGHIWIGTVDSGLLSVDIRKNNHLAYIQRSGSNGLSAGSIQVIFEDSLGYIWIGSDIGGVARLDPLYGGIRQYVHDSEDFLSISGDHIGDIIEDSTGRIWIGTDQGPVLYLPEVDGFEPAGVMMSGWPDFRGRHVLALEAGLDGSIWMSFKNGEMYRLDPRERDYSIFRFTPSSVPTILMVDPQGTLWAGSRQNLRIFNSEGILVKTWLPVGSENGGFHEGGVTAIFSDSQKRVWLGSPAGISFYKGYNDGFEPLQVPADRIINVSGITEDAEGNLWISDGRQILIYNPDNGFITTMGDDVGLTPSGLITGLTSDRNRVIYIGANGEIWKFDMYVDSPLIDRPRVYLTELKVMNKTRANGYGLDGWEVESLKSDEKMFSISFGAVDFRYQGEIIYQYRLEGVNDEWVDNGETNSVTYANLSPGKYEFSVRALNELGQNSDNKAVFSFIVERSFWRKPLAVIVYIAVLIGIIGFILKMWEGHLMKNQIRELEEVRMKVLEANKQLSFLSMSDTLTGLLNRRGFDRGIFHALGTAQRNNLLITLFMMDVDFFKLYNDNYGHVRGDEVLRGVGKAMRSVFERSTDIIARYGGEEFAVILPDTPLSGAVRVAEMIRKSV